MVEQKLRLCYKCCTRDVARVELICDMIQVVLRLRDTKWGVVRTPNTITRNGQSQLIIATEDRAQIDRHFTCIHSQKGIGYLVWAVFYGQLNCANFWAKIWPSKQPKVMNDTLDRQFSTYSRVRRRVLFQTLFIFWEIARCPVNCTHLMTLWLCKITTANDIQKMALSGPAIVFGSIDTERYFWFNKKILNSTYCVSSKSMESHLCTVQLNVTTKLYPVTISTEATEKVV